MRSWFANFVLVGALLASGCVQAAPAAQASYRVEAREILARSIAFPTVAGRKQVPAYANYLASVVRSHGVPEADIAIIPHGETVAMLIRIPGKDPKAAPVMFSSHMDVVEARAEDWELDPFVLVESDGHFIGRGVLDNKAGVVAMISTINRIKSEGLRPRHTLVFAFNGDEETTLETAQLIVDHPWVRGAELAINTDSWGGVLGPDGKPLIYMHQGAEKTYASFEITVTNPGGHSSRPRVDNAVYDLADILTRLRGLRFPIMTNEVSLAYLKAMGGVTKGALGEMLRRFVANPADAEAAEALAREPEYVGVTRTTCVPTLLKGGHAENAMPQSVVLTVNCRIFPGQTVDEVEVLLKQAIGDRPATLKRLYKPQPSPISPLRPDVARAIEKDIHSRHPGLPIAPYLESGASDSRVYRQAGLLSYGTGGLFVDPTKMFAHGRNERLRVTSFYEGLDHIHSLAVDLAGH